MKKTKIIFWVFTALLALIIIPGAVFDLISDPEAVKYITKLGYPAYLVPFLGVAKLLGMMVILIPGFPRLKEWAYAGLTIDLVGATFSHIAIGEPITTWAPMLAFFGILAGSYIFWHKLRKAKNQETAPEITLATN